MTVETGMLHEYEGTRTLVLIPDSNGRLTERARSTRGGRLTGYKFPVVSEDFKVDWRDELDHLEVNPDTLRRYPELFNAIRLLDGEPGFVYVHGWNKGLPVAFGKEPNEKFNKAKAWIDARYEYEFGERPLGRGYWTFGREGYMYVEWQDRNLHDTNLCSGPSVSYWRFRMGRKGN